MTATISPRDVRAMLLAREEIALIDVRDEDGFARGHPLFASQLPPDRIEVEVPSRLPRRDVTVVLYDDGGGRVESAANRLLSLGYCRSYAMKGGIVGWREEGFELFQDVNSYSKAFGELVEARRHTPSLSAQELAALLARGENITILDARRFEEYHVMSIPSGTSVPGAELVLRAAAIAPNPDTTIVVNCAGRTRSIIGAQSLINAGFANPVVALRNGTIGWKLAGQTLETGQVRRVPAVSAEVAHEARRRAQSVSYRAGVLRIRAREVPRLESDGQRTLYRFDVRSPEEYERGHPHGFRSAPGGQLVQEIDSFAPVRGARIALADDQAGRADMTASWLAQMGWNAYVVEGAFDGAMQLGAGPIVAPRSNDGRYRRPYEGTDHAFEAMEAYLRWELGLVEQLARDATHGFFVI